MIDISPSFPTWRKDIGFQASVWGNFASNERWIPSGSEDPAFKHPTKRGKTLDLHFSHSSWQRASSWSSVERLKFFIGNLKLT
jgi:hypothetical protein